jgi:hypothetical protein
MKAFRNQLSASSKQLQILPCWLLTADGFHVLLCPIGHGRYLEGIASVLSEICLDVCGHHTAIPCYRTSFNPISDFSFL